MGFVVASPGLRCFGAAGRASYGLDAGGAAGGTAAAPGEGLKKDVSDLGVVRLYRDGMSTIDSQELLREYVQEHSEAAFEQLVKRYVDLVYSVALRRVNGASSLAQDVAQSVFTELARKASSLPADVMLGGWLHRHTCFVAASTLRGEQRRSEREKQAVEMNALYGTSDSEWKQLAPVLDDAIDQLAPADRVAIILRFFEQQDLRAIGTVLGATEDAAQKRVSRALEKLRTLLVARGVTLSIAALGTILADQAVEAAPAGLGVGLAKGALSGGVAAGFVSAFFKNVPVAALKVASVVALIGVLATALIAHQRQASTSSSVGRAPVANRDLAVDTTAQDPRPAEATAQVSSPGAASSNKLHLVIVAADSGKPVPIVQIEYRGWEGDKFSGKFLRATRFGVCDVEIPRATITQLELTTRIDGFADTRLHWEQSDVRTIPTAYTMRLERPVSIGGRVVDPDGRPAAGAKVGFNHEDSPTTAGSPEDHHFSWIEVPTDTNGQWRIERIAPEMLRLIYGSASHPEHVQSPMIFVNQEQRSEERLRDGTFTFQLGRGVTARGSVSDSDGMPVTGAKVLVGKRGSSDSRHAETGPDGSFEAKGCRPGKTPVSAEADGFGATTIEAELTAEGEPVRLTLVRGKQLILRLVNESGQPVPKGYVWLDTLNQKPVNDPEYGKVPVQASFEGKPDIHGTVVWSNAPDTELTFDISAQGFMRTNGVKVRPDGREHVIVLPPAVVVSGTVRDANTGQDIPQFKVVTGWPETNVVDKSVRGHWSPFERDWLTFTDGQFHHSFEDPLIFGIANPGYMLRFTAEGYRAVVSRPIRADEAEVHLEVVLLPAVETTVSVLLPNNRPAARAEVGLAMPEAGLELVPGGFSHQNRQNAAALLMTDGGGTFRLPADETITAIIIAHPEGYAAVSPATLGSDPTVRLEPWGKLEGVYLAGGQPATNRDLLFQLGEPYSRAVSTSLDAYRVKTDETGRFVFKQVPPGKHKLVRLVPIGAGVQQHQPIGEVEIRSGETTTTTIGTDGYYLTARVRWPEGWEPKRGQRVFASVQTALPAGLVSLIDQAQQDPVRDPQVRQSPEFQEYARSAHHIAAAFEMDFQSVSAEQIPPGDYLLVISAMKEPAAGQSPVAPLVAQSSFSVPANPSSGTIDIGEMLLHPVGMQK
jgi:RNA polymerase sigma factor (sigma-70 family)